MKWKPETANLPRLRHKSKGYRTLLRKWVTHFFIGNKNFNFK